MEKIIELEKDGVVIGVLTDGISKNETYIDGAYEVFLSNGIAKIRCYSDTGISHDDIKMVENNLSIVMSENVLGKLSELISNVCDDRSLSIDVEEIENDQNVPESASENHYTEFGKFR